jgi:hypothetical protein
LLTKTLVRVALTRNRALAGAGGNGGVGGNGGSGGDALGGGAYTTDSYLGGGIFPHDGSTSLTILGSTFTRNEADGGLGDAGGLGGTAVPDVVGIDGGLYVASPMSFIDPTTRFIKNRASTSHNDIFGV